jgi:hypothetical protein
LRLKEPASQSLQYEIILRCSEKKG